ncbi:5'-nucleotidase family [Rhizoctonia solani]|uniref:5'-nucleotidase family n=1 Tax=Rhizoctonia solani TaxID=456999 RepID=A0A8H7M4J4_9AGAM|nr:5'-nucleotidase family [Rhizoctonia solani]
MSSLSILHFNDVYRVTKQKIQGSKETIDVTQFGELLDSLRDNWPKRSDGKRDGLVLFSGDVFSPSVESTVTRGSHMVPIMNHISPDASLTGNHDFDFGVSMLDSHFFEVINISYQYPHLCKLIEDCTFPWILSNIVDTDTNSTPTNSLNTKCLNVMALEEWIATVASWPPNFKYESMAEVTKSLSQELRDPEGPHKCDIVLALTHARYYIGRGAGSWDNYDLNSTCLGSEEDDGVFLVKSGTDFRDLSELTLELEDTPEGSIRRKVVKSIRGNQPPSPALTRIIKNQLDSVSSTLSEPICHTLTEWNAKSDLVRIDESALGDWMADVLRHAYDDALCVKGGGPADGVLICGGTLRGDSVYGPGDITLGDLLEILPFEDPIVVQALNGEAIWNALEAGLSTWPAQEGRFPIVSGIRIEWDSRLAPEVDKNGQPVIRDANKTYRIVTREYMAAGHDGYDALRGKPFLIDDENGVIMSSIVRRYLLGSQYIHTFKAQKSDQAPSFLSTSSIHTISKAKQRWLKAAEMIVNFERQRAPTGHSVGEIGDALRIAQREHMTDIDRFDGSKARCGRTLQFKGKVDLVVVAPIVDGRLKDLGRV